jgi:hypothetical protein
LEYHSAFYIISIWQHFGTAAALLDMQVAGEGFFCRLSHLSDLICLIPLLASYPLQFVRDFFAKTWRGVSRRTWGWSRGYPFFKLAPLGVNVIVSLV